MGELTPSPSVVVFDNLVGLVGSGGRGDVHCVRLLALHFNRLEVVVLALIEVGQVPEDADVFEA